MSSDFSRGSLGHLQRFADSAIVRARVFATLVATATLMLFQYGAFQSTGFPLTRLDIYLVDRLTNVWGILHFGASLLIAIATYRSIRAALTKTLVRAVWLRPFQRETGDSFRVSRSIDRLPRFGIAPLTLQDRDVRVSLEQRCNVLGPRFWALFLIAVTAVCALAVLMAALAPPREPAVNYPDSFDIFDRWTLLYFYAHLAAQALPVLALPFLILLQAIALLASLRAPRSELKKITYIVQRTWMKRRGATIVRVDDHEWREAVFMCLREADVVIADISDLTESIAWELQQANRYTDRVAFVFLCKGAVSDVIKAQTRALIDPERPHAFISYPPTRTFGESGFGRRLARAVFAVYDVAREPQP